MGAKEPLLLVEIRNRHTLVREKIGLLDQALHQLEDGHSGEGIGSRLAEMAGFLNGELLYLMDLEEAVFPPIEMAMQEIGGPVAALRMEHEELKRLTEVFSAAVSAFQRHESATLETLMWCAERLRSLIVVHLEKEETVMFQLAQKMLTVQDWAEAAKKVGLQDR